MAKDRRGRLLRPKKTNSASNILALTLEPSCQPSTHRSLIPLSNSSQSANSTSTFNPFASLILSPPSPPHLPS